MHAPSVKATASGSTWLCFPHYSDKQFALSIALPPTKTGRLRASGAIWLFCADLPASRRDFVLDPRRQLF